MAQHRELPNLGKMSDAEILDELGDARKEMNYYKRIEAIYKEAFLARLDESEKETGAERESDRFEALITPESQMRFDGDKTKEEMGEEWGTKHCKKIEFLKVSIKAIKKEES